MEFSIKVNREEVWQEVETHQAYQAAKSSPDYSKNRIKKSDREIFDLYYNEVINQLNTSYLSFLREPYEQETRFLKEGDNVIYLNVRDFSPSLIVPLQFHTKNMCVYYILTRWLTMLGDGDETAKAAASTSADLCDSNRLSIQRLLMKRQKPYTLKSQPM